MGLGSLVPRLSLLRAIIPRMTFDPAKVIRGIIARRSEEGEPGDEARFGRGRGKERGGEEWGVEGGG